MNNENQFQEKTYSENVPLTENIPTKSGKKNLILFIIIGIILLVIAVASYFLFFAGNKSVLNKTITSKIDNDVIIAKKNDELGVIDLKGNIKLNFEYYRIEKFEEGYSIATNGAYAQTQVVNKNGKKIITGIYKAEDYVNNYVVVKIDEKTEDYIYYLYDRKFKLISDKLEITDGSPFYMVVKNKDEKKGLINTKGKLVFDYKYSDISFPMSFTREDFTYFEDFPYFVVKLDNKDNIINVNSNKIILEGTSIINIGPKTYKVDGQVKYINNDKVISLDDNITHTYLSVDKKVMFVRYNDDTAKYIDLNGKSISDKYHYIKIDYSEGIVVAIGADTSFGGSDNEAFFYKDGIKIKTIKNDYKIAGTKEFADGFIEAIEWSTKKHVFLDKNFKPLSNVKYDDVTSDFNNGLAVVQKDGYFGVINTKGQNILDYKYCSVTIYKTAKEFLFRVVVPINETDKQACDNGDVIRKIVKEKGIEYKSIQSESPINFYANTCKDEDCIYNYSKANQNSKYIHIVEKGKTRLYNISLEKEVYNGLGTIARVYNKYFIIDVDVTNGDNIWEYYDENGTKIFEGQPMYY